MDEPFAWESREFLRKLSIGKVSKMKFWFLILTLVFLFLFFPFKIMLFESLTWYLIGTGGDLQS